MDNKPFDWSGMADNVMLMVKMMEQPSLEMTGPFNIIKDMDIQKPMLAMSIMLDFWTKQDMSV